MKKRIWLICRLLFIILILIAFSPLVLSTKTSPLLLGMPKTLWGGICVSLGFIILTLIGALVLNAKNDNE